MTLETIELDQSQVRIFSDHFIFCTVNLSLLKGTYKCHIINNNIINIMCLVGCVS